MENVVRSALIVSPLATARRAAVAWYAVEVGADLELRMGHHLGLLEETNEAAARENRRVYKNGRPDVSDTRVFPNRSAS
jgi:hypothetical protein